MINENHTNTNLLLDINHISRLQANCLCARILGFYNAYANLEFFARIETVCSVPESKLTYREAFYQ